MKVEQIYNLVNATTKEVLGDTIIVNQDLTNVVDVGKAIFDADQKDNFVKKLVDHIGKVVFVDRKYTSAVPSVLKDSWEFGSVLEKVRAEIPDAVQNDSWKLVDGQSYDSRIFHEPKVETKFYNSKVTFEVDMSITTDQLKSAFSSLGELDGFLSMIYNSIDTSFTIKLDGLIMSTINNFTAEVIKADYLDGDVKLKSGIKAVNLLYLYNDQLDTSGTKLTVKNCLTNQDFLKFASHMIKQYIKRLERASKLFNIGKTVKFTPKDKLHLVTLTNFDSACDTYLQSDTYHNELTKLPSYESVSYWQGSGKAYSFDDASSIDVKTATGKTVKQSGILAVMFDNEALGVQNPIKYVDTDYVPKGRFWNNFYKQDASYFNDLNENFIVFFVA